MAAPTRSVILYSNIADGKTYSIYTSGDSAYPASNLHDNDIHTVARTTSAAAARYFVINLGGALSYDTIAVAGCNGSTTTCLYASNGAGSDPTAFSYATAMTFSTVTHCGIYYWTSTQTAQYVAVRFNDSSLSYNEIGEIWLGMKMQLAVNPQIPIGIIRNTEITELLTGGGQRWSYEKYKQHGYDLSFIEDMPATGAGSFASIEQVYEARGYSLPFFFHNITCADATDTPLFVHATNYSFNIDGKNARPGTWTLEEEL